MKVLGIVGMPGSGKGEFSAIAASLGIPVVVMGDVIREQVMKAGLAAVDENMGIVARRLREEHGMAAIAGFCIPHIRVRTEPVVLVDGIRGDAEVGLFTETFPGFTLIAIDAPIEIRLSRLRGRGRSDDLLTMEALAARDERESSFGLKRAIEMAAIHIPNDAGLEVFRAAVTRLIRQMVDEER